MILGCYGDYAIIKMGSSYFFRITEFNTYNCNKFSVCIFLYKSANAIALISKYLSNYL